MTEKIFRLYSCLVASAYLTNGIVSELESYGVQTNVVLQVDKPPGVMVIIYVELGTEVRLSTGHGDTLRLKGRIMHSVSLHTMLDVMGIDCNVLTLVSGAVPSTRLKHIRDVFSLLIPMIWDRRRLI